MIRNGTDRQRLLSGSRRVGIQRRGFHLHRQHAQLLQNRIVRAVLRVKGIACVEGAAVCPQAHLPGRFHRPGQQAVIRAGRAVSGKPKDLHVCAVGIGAHPENDIPDFDLFTHGAGGTDPDNVLHAVKAKQLVGIDAHGGASHPAGHNRDPLSLPGTGVSLYPANVIHQLRVLQKPLRNQL